MTWLIQILVFGITLQLFFLQNASTAFIEYGINSFFKSPITNNWAVIVAGSSGFENYRHQADIAHAYQLLRGHGIEKEKIITMMYDDVANHFENPFPGKLFNNYSHIDVYDGVVIDYKGTDVTPEMFLQVLRGDRRLIDEGKKVLQSTQNDRVFIYFADHGANGLIAFPNDVLYAQDFNKALHFLHDNERFMELVVYIEACESGSMFHEPLPKNAKIYATTAANGEESSYACYCDDPDIFSCLGDTYSVNWMNDAETHNLEIRSLEEQYLAVKSLTNQSHVQQFGDSIISHEPLIDFEGEDKTSSGKVNLIYQINPEIQNKKITPPPDQISSRKAHLVPLLRKLKNAKSPQQMNQVIEKYHQHIKRERKVKRYFDEIVHSFISKKKFGIEDLGFYATREWSNNFKRSVSKNIFSCYKSAVNEVLKSCFSHKEYPTVLEEFYKLANLCTFWNDAYQISQQIKSACSDLS